MYAVVCKEMAVFCYSLHLCKFEINNAKESKENSRYVRYFYVIPEFVVYINKSSQALWPFDQVKLIPCILRHVRRYRKIFTCQAVYDVPTPSDHL